MKILVCGGKNEAEYVISAYVGGRNKIVVMNNNEHVAKEISETYDLEVLVTDPTKMYSFEIADVYNFDLIIALLDRDVDNFVCCKIAKERFAIKKAICTVSDPNNVEVFTRLGIDSPISASHLLKQRIEGETDIESLIKTMTLENDKIVITEITVKKEFSCCGLSLAQLQLPKFGNITCIYRDPSVVIPRGDTVIMPNDKLVIASAPADQKKIIKFIKKEKEDEEKQ
jgi:trk system potassium uptake protein TrkA